MYSLRTWEIKNLSAHALSIFSAVTRYWWCVDCKTDGLLVEKGSSVDSSWSLSAAVLCNPYHPMLENSEI